MTPPSWPAATLPGPSAPWPHDGAGPAMRSALAVGASPTAPRPRGAGRGGSQVLDMRQRERQEACSPADRASGQGAACRAPSPAQRGAGRGGGRPGLGGLWLLLVPVEGCGGPLLVAGLAAARTLAWAGSGSRSPLCWQASCWPPGCAGGAAPGTAWARGPGGAGRPSRRFPHDDQKNAAAASCRHRRPAGLWMAVAKGEMDDSPADRTGGPHHGRGCAHPILSRPEVSGGPVRCDRHRHGNRW